MDGPRPQHPVLSLCPVAILSAAALASGHSNINDPLAVPARRGTQPGELTLPTCPVLGSLLMARGRIPRTGFWLCSHPFPPAGPGARHIMQVLPPRHLLSLMGL